MIARVGREKPVCETMHVELPIAFGESHRSPNAMVLEKNTGGRTRPISGSGVEATAGLLVAGGKRLSGARLLLLLPLLLGALTVACLLVALRLF